jgi:hypothetical protein
MAVGRLGGMVSGVPGVIVIGKEKEWVVIGALYIVRLK